MKYLTPIVLFLSSIVSSGLVFGDQTQSNTAIILQDLNMEFHITPDGPQACIQVELLSLDTTESEKSYLCWDVPKKVITYYSI